jgi:hypothetical protein
MARIRTLKPQFFTSEDICKRSPLARLLFAGLWCEADRAGRLADNPFQLKLRLMPAEACDVDALLWELASSAIARQLIRRYLAEDGNPYIQVLTFEEHQRPHPKEPPSTIPATGRERKRPAVEKHGEPVNLPGSITEALEPHRAVEKNGEQVNQPGCFPSSPVGREGKEYGVREGKGREGVVESPTTAPRRLIAGEASPMGWAKVHSQHVPEFCDWVCLPEFVFAELCRKSGQASRDDSGAAYVRGWAQRVRAEWGDRVVAEDGLKFWRARWEDSHREAQRDAAQPSREAVLDQVREKLAKRGVVA